MVKSVLSKVGQSDLTFGNQERLLLLQRDTLESVAISNNREQQLRELCLAAEAMLPNAVASIMLLNDDATCLNVRMAPSIPPQAVEELNGMTPGPHSGSCGTAVYCKSPVYVENTLTDHRWQSTRQFAINFNVQACWSNPVYTNETIIGSFALSSFEHRKPGSFQKDLLKVCASLSSIILQREKMEQDLHRLAYFDGLTQLPNRDLFNQQLEHALDKAERNNTTMALLYIDVDNFKYVNDSYGHAAGDKVLISVAKTLKNSIRESDCLARLGGDEFVILLEDLDAPLQASQIAQTALLKISSNPNIQKYNSSISIGISIYPNDASSSANMLRNADTAMYAAKSSGKNQLYFYQPELTAQIQQQVELVNELKRAIRNEEFVLHYQPIYRCSDLSIHGVEALIRWQHPEKGLLGPFSFISTAEKQGLIGDISKWVLKTALTQAKTWLDNGLNIHRVSINLSVEDIKTNFHETIKRLLFETDCPPEHLQFEITETLLMEYGITVIDELKKIRDLGIMIAIDDFGTGYSSLNQLKKLPVDKLKIDRSFVKDIPADNNDITLTKMILSMSKHLSLSTIAEGVETKAQADFLINQGCEYLQGYLYAKPMPERQIISLLGESANWPAVF